MMLSKSCVFASCILVLFLQNQIIAQTSTIPVIDKTLIAVDDLLWDLDELSIPPEVEWLDQGGTVKSLLYKGVDYQGNPTEVFAWYSNPDLIMGRPSSGEKFPGVVLVHGGGGKAFKEWVEKWAADGYAAIAMDLAGKGPDGKRLNRPGPDQRGHDKFGSMETGNLREVWSYHAVSSVVLSHSFLLNLPEVDENKTCITGISWGGYLTTIAASLDNRFQAAAPVYGCGFYDESDVFSEPLNQLSSTAKQQWMSYFDHSVYLSSAQSSFLFLNGNKDQHYNVVPYHKTYSLVPKEIRTIAIKPDMKHSHEHGWEPQEIRYFFESVVNQAPPLIQVGDVVEKDGRLRLTYQSPVGLYRARFYYTNDTLSSNIERKWEVQGAVIDATSGIVSCPIPESDFKYGFFYLVDHRHLSVSSEFIIK